MDETIQKQTLHSDGTARAAWLCPWMAVPCGAGRSPVCMQEGGRAAHLQLLRISRSVLLCVCRSQNRNIKSELGQNCYVPFICYAIRREKSVSS